MDRAFLQRAFDHYQGEQHQKDAIASLSQSLTDAQLADFAKRFSPPQTQPQVPPYWSQRDNSLDPNGTCFSSTCAMLVKSLKPDAIQSDEEYLKHLARYGATTVADTHIRILREVYGINAEFVTNASYADLDAQLAKGIPVPTGWLHRGPIHEIVRSGGHWSLVIGSCPGGYLHHDPYGESNLLTGATVSSDGESKCYSRQNWGDRRWMADGPGSGWAILADRPKPTVAGKKLDWNQALQELKPSGASPVTAKGAGVAIGPQASETLARQDFDKVKRLIRRFQVVGQAKDMPPSVLAAIASRESRIGSVLIKGWGDGGDAFGIMQINKHFHTLEGLESPDSLAHIQQAASILSSYRKTIRAAKPTWSDGQVLQGAIAAYNCGPDRIGAWQDVDKFTTGKDYSNDVVARAQYFEAQGV